MEDNQNVKASMRITKNTTISVGLGVIMASFIFWFGMSLGKAETRADSHEALPSHAGTTEMLKGYMPRKEVDTNLLNITRQLDDIQETQKQILFKLNGR